MKKQITIVIDDECQIFRAGIKAILDRLDYKISYIEISRPQGSVYRNAISNNTIFFINAEQYSVKEAELYYGGIAPLCQNRIIFYYSKNRYADMQMLFESFTGISFIQKDATPEEFLMAFEQLLEGRLFYCSQTLHWLSLYMNKQKQILRVDIDKRNYTRREIEIINLICTEYTAKEIGNKLKLSKRTIENHKTRILEKMQVKNMAGIVKYALENDLINNRKEQ